MKQGNDVYVCHSKKDAILVENLCKVLDEQGISYITSHQGEEEKLPTKNVDDINSCTIFVFVATHNAYRSPFAVKELVYAFNNIATQNIIVYQADDAKLPENIAFTTHKNNIISSDHHLISSSLIQKICNLLNRDIQPFDEYDYDVIVPTSIDWIDTFFMYIFPFIGIALAIVLGWLQQSIVFGGSVFVAAVCLFFAYIFVSVDDFYFKTPVGKVVSVIQYLLSLAMFTMIPVCTWIGISSESWKVGILWFGGSWTVIIALLVIFNRIESTVDIGKTALFNYNRSKNLYDIFLCYDENDITIVERIKTELKRNGLTFITRQDMPLQDAVDKSYAFLYIGSSHSYNNAECNDELVHGFNHRRPILAYAVDQTEMPEDKKLAFSDSNLRSITTHPIETTLMSDLREILKEARARKIVKVASSFWRTLLLVICNVLVLIAAFVIGYMQNSISITIAIILSLMLVVVIISDVSDKRKEITLEVSTETIVFEIALTLSAAVVPTVLWWIVSPTSTWYASLLVFLLFVGYGAVMMLVEKLVKGNPVGALSPQQVGTYFDVFISYSRKDTTDADEICDLLERSGITYFIDRQGIPGGSEFPTVLADAISNCGIFIFLMSYDSLTSKFCKQEFKYAKEKKNDKDILILFRDKDTEERFYNSLVGNEKAEKIFRNYPQLCKEETWEPSLVRMLRTRLPETSQYKKHNVQTTGHSWGSVALNTTKDYAVNNPIASITLAVLAISGIIGICFHSWTVALGVYSFLVPVPLYLTTHSVEKSFITSSQVWTLGIWLGLVTNSVWIGIIACFVDCFVCVLLVKSNNFSNISK